MLASFCQVFSIAMWHVLYVKSNLNSVDNSISAVILRSLGGVIFSQNFKKTQTKAQQEKNYHLVQSTILEKHQNRHRPE